MRAAQGAGHTWIGTEHLLIGLSDTKAEVVASVFHERGLTTGALKQAMTETDADPEDEDQRALTLESAARIATKLGDSETARRIEALIQRLPR
jgi:ATP-dependent Clp protease ATP-binding subunit ClpA